MADEKKNTRRTRESARQRWCFTINNYTAEHEQELKGLYDSGVVKYMVYGREIAPETGTPHLQGYLNFGTSRKRMSTVKNLCSALNASHLEAARGNGTSNKKYCTKGGDFEEFGELINQGKRSDLEDLKEAIQDGEYKMYNLLSQFGAAWKYPKVTRNFVSLTKRQKLRMTSPLEEVKLHAWQEEVMQIVAQPADPRKIHWYWDPIGATGKSTMVRHLRIMFPNRIFYTTGGKCADVLHAYVKEDCPDVIIFDLPRDKEDFVHYGTFEALKNGMFTSTKYDSQSVMRDVPILLVFANFEPDKDKLSMDRWDVNKIVVV